MHPRHSKKSIFKEIFAGRGELEGEAVNIAVLLTTTTNKKVVNFLRKNESVPPEKILATPMDIDDVNCQDQCRFGHYPLSRRHADQ